MQRIVASKLKEDSASQQIAGWLKSEYPQNPELWGSHETIYRSLFVPARGALTESSSDIWGQSDESVARVMPLPGARAVLAVPFPLVGAFLLLWLLNYHLSVAVWVGIIALAGVDAETGMVTLLYLDVSYERWKREGRMGSIADLEGAVMEGAVQRVRPKLIAILMGLVPIM